jgi:hypothetical protein
MTIVRSRLGGEMRIVYYPPVTAEGEDVDLDTIALALEIADEEAETVVRSNGMSSKHSDDKTLFKSPSHNPEMAADFARAANYLVRRGLALRITAKSIAL